MTSVNKKVDPREEYPLHWAVWHNDSVSLKKHLDKSTDGIETRDCRGRTPLMLAVTLGHLESARILLNYGANANVENKEGYTATHESTSTGDPELLTEVLTARDLQKYRTSVNAIPNLLKRIRDTPDFYVEMKWEFTSWIPLLSRICPSDTYKIYKSGANVRIDTTLLGFDQTSWQRGSRSYIFKGHEDTTALYEVNHDTRQVHVELLEVASDPVALLSLRPDSAQITARLTSPVMSTFVDTERINFERNKSGLLGWRSDRVDTINGYECKVFSATNVDIITRTRTEHLSEEDKLRHRQAQSPLQSFLGTLTEERGIGARLHNGDTSPDAEVVESRGNPCHIKADEYFDPRVTLEPRDIGRPREVAIRTQRFKATLWLCEDYPLSLPQQILPIVDLMSLNSSHFAKLKDFITLQLPAGFPVKIEIPLFHVLNARVTFGNINGVDASAPGLTTLREDGHVQCAIDENVFDIPQGYSTIGVGFRGDGTSRRDSFDEDSFLRGARNGGGGGGAASATGGGGGGSNRDSVADDDRLLRFAIQQSLVESGSEDDKVTVWEALTASKPANEVDDVAYQRAIQESYEAYLKLKQQQNGATPTPPSSENNGGGLLPNGHVIANGGAAILPRHVTRSVGEEEDELSVALKLSAQLCGEEDERRRREEEEMIEQVIKLSLMEQ